MVSVSNTLKKQSTLTKWLQPKRAEIQADIAEHYSTYFEGEEHRAKPDTTKLTNTKEFTETKNAWTNTGIVSYNVETLGEGRINTIVREMGNKDIKIMMMQGTSSRYNGDSNNGDFKIFYTPNGVETHERSAGVAIIIHKDLLKKSTVKKMVLIDHRALAVRIKNNYIDITVISAYGYTEHTDQTKRKNGGKTSKKKSTSFRRERQL